MVIKMMKIKGRVALAENVKSKRPGDRNMRNHYVRDPLHGCPEYLGSPLQRSTVNIKKDFIEIKLLLNYQYII